MDFQQLVRKATRSQRLARIHLYGFPNAGKTASALKLAKGICSDIKDRKPFILMFDVENGRSELYAELEEEGYPEFSIINWDHRSFGKIKPEHYIEFISEASTKFDPRPDLVIIDSFTHFWQGVCEIALKSNRKWIDARPVYDKALYEIIYAPFHVILTSRAKFDFDKLKNNIEEVEYQGDNNLGYEVDFSFLINRDTHTVECIQKCPGYFEESVFYDQMLSEHHGELILNWLRKGIDTKRYQVVKNIKFLASTLVEEDPTIVKYIPEDLYEEDSAILGKINLCLTVKNIAKKFNNNITFEELYQRNIDEVKEYGKRLQTNHGISN